MSHYIDSVRSCANNLIDFILPPRCLGCNVMTGEQGGLCPSCWSSMRFISKPFCQITGRPFSHDLGEEIISAEAIANPPAFHKLRSVVTYDDVARKILSNFKFSDGTELAPWMADWMQVAGRELIEQSDMITAVPLHRWRLFSRQYNQSAELARQIASSSIAIDNGLVFDPQLVNRLRKTRQQVGLNAKERERNVRGAFAILPEKKPEIEGRRILLVDDVYTTGATVNAVSRALKRAGAEKVNVLTFAMVHGEAIW